MQLSIIVPAFNEKRSLGSILKTLQQAKQSNWEIVVVDDGSIDDTSQVAQSHQGVVVHKLPNNQGKTAAVLAGAHIAKHDHILLVDADLEGLNADDLSALCKLYEQGRYRMLIMNYGAQDKILTQILKMLPAQSGVRIMRKADLLEVPLNNHDRFKLENKINRHFIEHDLSIGVVNAQSLRTPYKHEKYPTVQGMLMHVPAIVDMLSNDRKSIWELYSVWSDWQTIHKRQFETIPLELLDSKQSFSIVIPTLNEEAYIGNLLSDLQKQDYPDFEIIHVDAHSHDNTCQVVDTFKKVLNISTIYSDRKNLSHQRNLGADHAQGKYVIFVDADTRITQRSFISKLAIESKKSMRLVYFPRVRVENNDPALRLAFSVYNSAISTSQFFTSPLPTQGLAIFERNYFRHIGGYRISEKHDKKILFAEDQEILQRIRKAGVVGKALTDIFYLMSLRRYEREGWLHVVPKLLMSAVEQSLGKSFIKSEYEMGGHMYQPKDNPSAPHKKH